MNALVTGAAGLYGCHLVKKMLEQQEFSQVFGVDNFSRRFHGSSPVCEIADSKFHLQRMDFQDLALEELDSMNLDVLVHLAAYVSVPESMSSPRAAREYFFNNEFGTFDLMQKLVQTKNKPLMVYASSGAVYGQPLYHPVDVLHQLNPTSVYAATKLAAEKHCMAMYYSLGYPVVVIRNFNTFGENQSLFDDAGVVSSFIHHALLDEPLVIHGDGEQECHMQYVKDAAEAYLQVCLNGKKLVGEIYNLRAHELVTINQLAEMIVGISGSKSAIVHEEVRSCDNCLPHITDTRALSEVVQWRHNFSLEEGLRNSIEWYSSEIIGKKPDKAKNLIRAIT